MWGKPSPGVFPDFFSTFFENEISVSERNIKLLSNFFTIPPSFSCENDTSLYTREALRYQKLWLTKEHKNPQHKLTDCIAPHKRAPSQTYKKFSNFIKNFLKKKKMVKITEKLTYFYQKVL